MLELEIAITDPGSPWLMQSNQSSLNPQLLKAQSLECSQQMDLCWHREPRFKPFDLCHR